MTRTLSILDTTCIECGQNYETVEEAIECENLDREDREADEEEAETNSELDRFLTELHQIQF